MKCNCYLKIIFLIIYLICVSSFRSIRRMKSLQCIHEIQSIPNNNKKALAPLYFNSHDSNKFCIDEVLKLNAASESDELEENGGIGDGAIDSNYNKIGALAGLIATVSIVAFGRDLIQESGFDFGQFLQNAATQIEGMGPTGYLYFGVLYTIAEILAVPATPLTASAGYLFGLVPGTITVLVAATIAAAVSFAIGRTALRSWAEELAASNAKWRAIDKAVSREGFKVVLLLRLSPLLPFALSNYLYALTSIDFGQYLLATFLGFAPGTFGIVYAGSAGKDIFSGATTIPWYGYAAGAAIIFVGGQTIGKIATDAVKEIEGEGAFDD